MATTHDSAAISLPKGGGAQRGLGEKFSPDLHTGTGNFSVPLELPPGRNGLKPDLALGYSTGQGNGPFGLGWALSVPGVARRTSKGVPAYDDARDTFVLSGAEDLIPVPGGPDGATRYRPRTEGSFAQIDHFRGEGDDYWRVRSKDGLVSVYGTPGSAGADPAAVAEPERQHRVFGWRLTRTVDPFGNHIDYRYTRDESRRDGPHLWDQLYLSQIRYVDYGDPEAPRYLVSVRFVYETRPDPFSDYRAGFEIRTVRRCRRIEVSTHADESLLARSYDLRYADELGEAPLNGCSLLAEVQVTGHDGEELQSLPPLRMSYSRFAPEGRRYRSLSGRGGAMPERSLADGNLDLVDLFGTGLPDLVAVEDPVRYWRNLGAGKLDRPRTMRHAPAGVALADPGTALADLNGNGRGDLLVNRADGGPSGYYPLSFGGEWDSRGFVRFDQAPTMDLDAPDVRLLDLDGDGDADVIRAGSSVELFYNRGEQGWKLTPLRTRGGPGGFPEVSFDDPRVKTADLTGDGLTDVVLVRNGRVDYWPYLGHGRWGDRLTMHSSPRFEDAGSYAGGFDPRRLFFADFDGDGLADMAYVSRGQVTVWMNRAGNAWSDPVTIRGTPPVNDLDAVRIADVEGNGMPGILWSYDAGRYPDSSYKFLDLTGGTKPYLLREIDNGIGARTKIEYTPSTFFYLQDQDDPKTRWKTPLPFPAHVVSRVEAIDELSRGRLVTRYRYHHGYWDGAEREFRGFGRVDQLDAETFEEAAPGVTYSPPTETRTWFHQGALDGLEGPEEVDHRQEHWKEDPGRLRRPAEMEAFLGRLRPPARRDALRSLRGRVLRSELYARDGPPNPEERPYSVTEHLYGVMPVPVGQPLPDDPQCWQERVFFPCAIAERTTQWERGDEPMTSYTITAPRALGGGSGGVAGDYDAYGQPRSQISVAVPRGTNPDKGGAEPYLATQTVTERAYRDDRERFIVDRVARATTIELKNDGRSSVAELVRTAEDPRRWALLSQAVSFYDGDAPFKGLDFGKLGLYGALVRTESLVMTDAMLKDAHRSGDAVLNPPELPPYLDPAGARPWGAEYPPEFRTLPRLAGYTHPAPAGAPSAARGYWAATERSEYDFQGSAGPARGLRVASMDALGRTTLISHERPFDLLPASTTDAVGLTTTAKSDYRVLQPRVATDPNGKRTTYTYTPLGLVASVAMMGKEGEAVGDTETLPGTRFSYDFLAFHERGQPISVRTIRRVHHASPAVDSPARDETIEQVEYSDGFGRLIQTRAQAEDTVFGDRALEQVVARGDSGLPVGQSEAPKAAQASERSPNEPPNVVVSGWKVYDNKGQVVGSYEPFFAKGWAYAQPTPAQLGVRTRTYYDARSQVVRVVFPDDSEQRVVHGVPRELSKPDSYRPSPWEVYTYDQNDNAGRTHENDSKAYETHWNTPSSAVCDALGRTVRTTERLGPKAASEWYVTRSRYDIRGNVLSVLDALGRTVVASVYDLANRVLRTKSLDAGVERAVFDAAGQPVERRTATATLALRRFDLLGRPLRVWARDRAGEPVTLRERIEYGDASDPNQTKQARDAARAANTLGRTILHFDEAGLIFRSYDFKGNVQSEDRWVIADKPILASFAKAGPKWRVPTFRVNWEPLPGTSLGDHAKALLEPAAHTTSMGYDALNRVTTTLYPKDATGTRRKLEVSYNRGGARERLVLDGTPLVRRIVYNARGQRILVVYDNGLMSRHAYDPRTFRLARTRTERVAGQLDAPPYQGTGPPVQELGYRYDLAGNILSIDDRTPGAGVEGTPDGADRLLRVFGYDALYRLTAATGRECTNLASPRPWEDVATCGAGGFDHGSVNQGNAPKLTRHYLERYSYDAAGNLLSLVHQRAGAAGWTRRFGMGGMKPADWEVAWRSHLDPKVEWVGGPGNRLTHLGDVQTHFFDADGNLVRQLTSSHYEWDSAGRMRSFRVQVPAAGSKPTEGRWNEPSRFTHYLYDAGGQRVKKLTRTQGGKTESATYIGGIFEEHRFANAKRGTTLSVLDGDRRVASRRLGAAHPEDRSPEVKYQLEDHLGSGVLAVDQGGRWVNREEYSPYGETTFGSFAKKRYRFTGKERDEESGLYYHGARYYAPWLGRWINPDPAGLVDGLNLFRYARGNPVKLVDSTGRAAHGLNDVVPYTEKISNLSGIGHMQKDHTIAQGKQALINPAIDARNQMTVLQETGRATSTAGARPHTLATFHDPQADVKEINRLRQLTPDDWARSSFEAEIVSPSLDSRYRSGYDVDATNKATLDELGSMFEVDQPNRAPEAPKQLNLSWTKASEAQIAKEQKSLAAAADAAAKASTSKMGKFVTESLEVLAKKGGKVIPLVGVGVGVGLAASEAHAGNYAGAFVELAGASEIPIVSQVADIGSLVADVAWVAKEAFDPERNLEQWYYNAFLR